MLTIQKTVSFKLIIFSHLLHDSFRKKFCLKKKLLLNLAKNQRKKKSKKMCQVRKRRFVLISFLSYFKSKAFFLELAFSEELNLSQKQARIKLAKQMSMPSSRGKGYIKLQTLVIKMQTSFMADPTLKYDFIYSSDFCV